MYTEIKAQSSTKIFMRTRSRTHTRTLTLNIAKIFSQTNLLWVDFLFGRLIRWLLSTSRSFSTSLLFICFNLCACVLAHSFARKQSYYNILHIADALVSFNLLTFHIITRVTRFSHVVTLTFALNRSNFYSCALTVCTMAPLFLSIRHFMFSLSLSLFLSIYQSVCLSVGLFGSFEELKL